MKGQNRDWVGPCDIYIWDRACGVMKLAESRAVIGIMYNARAFLLSVSDVKHKSAAKNHAGN